MHVSNSPNWAAVGCSAVGAGNIFLAFGTPWLKILHSFSQTHATRMRPVSALFLAYVIFKKDGPGWSSDALYALIGIHPLLLWVVLHPDGRRAGFAAHAFHPCIIGMRLTCVLRLVKEKCVHWNRHL